MEMSQPRSIQAEPLFQTLAITLCIQSRTRRKVTLSLVSNRQEWIVSNLSFAVSLVVECKVANVKVGNFLLFLELAIPTSSEAIRLNVGDMLGDGNQA